jgi:hypothetical protein
MAKPGLYYAEREPGGFPAWDHWSKWVLFLLVAFACSLGFSDRPHASRIFSLVGRLSPEWGNPRERPLTP